MIVELKIRREGNRWIFDDKEKGIKEEPFVEGTSELIDKFIPEEKWNQEHLVIASNEDFSEYSWGHETSLVSHDENTRWSTYQCSSFGTHRLCPVLLEYFGTPPETIFFTFR